MKLIVKKKMKVGRPRKEVPYEMVSFTLKKKVYDELSRVARLERASKSEVVSRCARQYFGDVDEDSQISSLQDKINRIAAIIDEEDVL